MSSTTLHPALLLQRLQAIAEETRLHLVQMLAGGERCVCELQDDLGGAAQSRLSFHLRKLKEAGVVSDRKEGRWVYYTLVPGALEELRDLLGELAAGGGVLAPGGELTSGPARTASARELAASTRGSATSARDLAASTRGSAASALPRGEGGCCAPRPADSTPRQTGCC
jgi:ArsR family transcriptional regulator, arsenate/arsenite/antimonite-responsive transcriptional repressor